MPDDLRYAIANTLRNFRGRATLLHRDSWQGLKVAAKPEMATFEIIGHTIQATLGTRDLDYYRAQIVPDLPWADDHFAERVSGQPLNPPPSEAWWPHSPGGNKAFKEKEIFSHTYPERLWPRRIAPHGIRYRYGDLNDVINLLVEQPYTRQAYIPIFYPEDTGNHAHVRTPCTLGYHILLTHHLDIFYFIRSCDLLRHFRNDVYFAVRLLLWLLDRLTDHDEKIWRAVKPGTLRMHISNLHCFRNDWHTLYGEHR